VSSHQHPLILRTAIHYVRTTLKIDRAIVLYDGLGLSHGFEAGTLWDKADLSQGVLEHLIAGKQTTMIADATSHPLFAQRTSTVLSNIGSVLFFPLHDRAEVMRGFLYLDQSRLSRAVMTRAILERVESYVKETLQPMLHSLREDLTWEETLRVQWLTWPEGAQQEPVERSPQP
jgi:hypothetical protein